MCVVYAYIYNTYPHAICSIYILINITKGIIVQRLRFRSFANVMEEMVGHFFAVERLVRW